VDPLLLKWTSFKSVDGKGLKDAKLRVVRRLGDMLRRLDRERHRPGAPSDPDLDDAIEHAYRVFFDIACDEPSYGVRYAVTEQIGAGGDRAFRALDGILHQAWEEPTPGPHQHDGPAAPGGPPGLHDPEWRRTAPEMVRREHGRHTVCAWLTPLFVVSA